MIGTYGFATGSRFAQRLFVPCERVQPVHRRAYTHTYILQVSIQQRQLAAILRLISVIVAACAGEFNELHVRPRLT